MATVYQSTSTSAMVTVTNGDALVVRSAVDIYAPGTAVTLSGGTLTTRLINDGDIYGTSPIRVDASTSRIVNNGGLTATLLDAIEFRGGLGYHYIENAGRISSAQDLIDISSVTGPVNVEFVNTGTAIAQGSIFSGSENLNIVLLNNAGRLSGAVLDMDNSFSAQLVNTGILDVSRIEMGSMYWTRFNNSGVIGDVYGNTHIATSDGDDTAQNAGTIFGWLDLKGGADRFESSDGGWVSGHVEGGDGNDTLSGGSDADELRGGNDQDLLVGRDGDDTLLGDAGFDMLLGGNGNDVMDGGNNNDTLIGNGGDDTMAGGYGNDLLLGQDGVDQIDGGAGNDTMDGGAGNDVLEGGAGTDVLRGRGGEDELSGGEDLDFYTGGTGADVFVFRSITHAGIGAQRDQILDFEQGLDVINVVGMSPGVFEFRGTAGFAPSGNPELRLFETPTGSTIVQVDVDGDGSVDAEIRVANVTGLTAEDFAL